MSPPESVSPDEQAISVVIAEDYTIVRDALSTMLSFEDEIDVVATTSSGAEAVQLTIDLRPDIVLMDVGLDDLNGIDATRKIVEAAPDVRVVVLSMYEDEDTVTRAIAAGALGYVPKTASREELVHAIRTIAGGEAFLHHTVTGAFLRRIAPLADQSFAEERLTDRENDVLIELAKGMTTKQIAGALSLGEETVKSHLARIYQKLGVTDRVQAVASAIRRGLVP